MSKIDLIYTARSRKTL